MVTLELKLGSMQHVGRRFDKVVIDIRDLDKALSSPDMSLDKLKQYIAHVLPALRGIHN